MRLEQVLNKGDNFALVACRIVGIMYGSIPHHIVWDSGSLLRRGRCGANGQLPIDLPRVYRHNGSGKVMCQSKREARLTDARRARQKQDVPPLCRSISSPDYHYRNRYRRKRRLHQNPLRPHHKRSLQKKIHLADFRREEHPSRRQTESGWGHSLCSSQP